MRSTRACTRRRQNKMTSSAGATGETLGAAGKWDGTFLSLDVLPASDYPRIYPYPTCARNICTRTQVGALTCVSEAIHG